MDRISRTHLNQLNCRRQTLLHSGPYRYCILFQAEWGVRTAGWPPFTELRRHGDADFNFCPLLCLELKLLRSFANSGISHSSVSYFDIQSSNTTRRRAVLKSFLYWLSSRKILSLKKYFKTGHACFSVTIPLTAVNWCGRILRK
jgi:hypothetical protein